MQNFPAWNELTVLQSKFKEGSFSKTLFLAIFYLPVSIVKSVFDCRLSGVIQVYKVSYLSFVRVCLVPHMYMYSKTCLKRPAHSKIDKTKILMPNKGQKYCRMHYAILLTCIKR